MGRITFQDTTPRFWYRLGFSTGAVTVVFLVVVYLAVRNVGFFQELKEILKEWQPLTAGLIALLGAWLTVLKIGDQIQLARDQDEIRRERKQFADRSAMPTALVALVDYVRDSVAILKRLSEGGEAGGRILFASDWVRPEIPDYPFEGAKTLRTCLETTEKDKREPIATILRQLQIQNTRLKKIVREVSPGSHVIVLSENLYGDMILNLDLLVRCNNTFRYARDEEPYPFGKVEYTDISKAAFFEGIDEMGFGRVYERMKQAYPVE